MRRILAIALGLLLGLAIMGDRAVFATEQRSAELWHVESVKDPTSGTFSYCAVESGFDNGLSLAFARNRELNTNIVVSFPDKRLEERTKFRMMIGVDDKPIREVVGFSANADTLVIPLQHDRALIGWLQNGKLLEIKGPKDSVKFALDGAGDAIRQLQQCVETNIKTETVSAGGAPAARPPVATGPLALNLPPADDQMVEPLPLPSAGTPPAAPAPVTVPAPAPVVTPAPPVATPEKTATAEITIEQADEAAAKAEAARLLARQQAEKAKADADAAAVEAAKQQAAKDQAAKDEAARQALVQAQAAKIEAAKQQAAQEQAAKDAAALEETQKAAAAKIEAARQEAAKAQAAKDAAALAQAKEAAVQPAIVPAPPIAAPPPVKDQAPTIAQIDRPNVAALPLATPATQTANSLAEVLKQAGIPVPGSNASDTYTWKMAALTGSASEVAARKPFIDAMLDNLDVQEKRCQGPFSSTIGAPMQNGTMTYSEVATVCGDTTGVILYYQKAGRFGIVTQLMPSAARDSAVSTRQIIEKTLIGATNYK